MAITATQIIGNVTMLGATESEAGLVAMGAASDVGAASLALVGRASASASAYLSSLGARAFTTGVGFDGLAAGAASLDASLASVDASAATAKASLASVGTQAEVTKGEMSGMGGVGVLAAAAFIALGAIVAIKSSDMAANFQQAVNRLRTGAGDVTDSFATLSSGILKVSIATGILSGPLTKAMYEILSSGQRGALAFSTLAAAAKGAVIEQANVVDVSDTLAGTMTNFGTRVFGAVAYMNGLITAVSLGRITLQNLSTAMGPIEPVAHAMGISFADLAAAMSTQTNATIPAARAATGLRFMMQALEVPTTKAKNAMIEWGLSSVAVADEMKVSLPGALQMIYDAAKKAGPEGSVPFNRAVSDMVGGQRSLSTFLALTGTHMQAFKDNANAIAASMKSGAGDVQGWALAQTNFNVIWDKGKAVLEAIAITIGTQLLPVLGTMVGWVVSAAQYVSNFKDHAGVLVPILAGVGAVLVSILVPAMIALAASVLAATWPFLAIGVAVAGLVAIFMHFYQTNAGFKTFVDQLVVGFKQVASYVVANFIPAMKQIGAFLHDNVLPMLQQAGDFLVKVFTPVWKELVDVWNKDCLPAMRQLWTALQPLLPVLKLVAEVIIGVVIVSLVAIALALVGLVKILSLVLQGFSAMASGAAKVITWLTDIVTNKTEQMRIASEQKFVAMKIAADTHTIAMAKTVIANYETQRAGILQKLKETHDPAEKMELQHQLKVLDIRESAEKKMLAAAEADKVKQLAKQKELHDQMLEAQKWFGQRWLDQMGGWINDQWAKLTGMIGGWWTRLGQLKDQVIQRAKDIVNGFIDWLAKLPGRAFDAIVGLNRRMDDFFGGLASQAFTWGTNILVNLASGIINSIGSTIGNALGQVGNFISQHLPHSPAKVGPLRDLALQGASISEQIALGMLSGMPKISAAMTGLLKPVTVGVTGTANYSGLAYRGAAGSTAPQIIVQPPDIYLDGVRLSRGLMPYVANAIRYNVGGFGV